MPGPSANHPTEHEVAMKNEDDEKQQAQSNKPAAPVASSSTRVREAEEDNESNECSDDDMEDDARADRVVYIYDDRSCDINFSSTALFPHSMKPYRVLATHELIMYLGLDKHVRILCPPALSLDALSMYHSPEYLANLTLHNTESWMWHPDISRVPFTADCPPVEGIVEHSLSVASGSLMGAVLLNAKEADTVIHWGGGMHHARCGECAGFCYVNDIVLAILELLKTHHRVLYIDIDVHHGDGVEEAFLKSDRVFTLSLHRFGDSFFPGTGSPHDIGMDRGRWFSMNIPLWEGIEDFPYSLIFRHAVSTVMERFQPEVIVMQCGADSLAGDRVGVFQLTSAGHSFCVDFVQKLGVPLLVLGGGGYTVKNVARLWAYETSVLCGQAAPLNMKIDITKLPLTGWLYETCPVLGIAEELSAEHHSVMVHTQTQKIISQIDRHADHIYRPDPPQHRTRGNVKEEDAENKSSHAKEVK